METTYIPHGNVIPTPSSPAAIPDRVPRAREALLGAAALGVLGDALLREGPVGVGFVLFVGALLLVLDRLTRRRGVRWTLGATLLLAPVLWCASVMAWRGSDALAAFNLLALLAALSALSWALLRGDAWEPGESGIGDYLSGAFKSGVSAAVGVVPLISESRIGELTRSDEGDTRRRVWAGVARGAIVAFPVVVVFGTLFSAADPVFDRLVRESIDLDVTRLLSHLFVVGFVGWPVAGYLRSASVAPIDERLRGRLPSQPLQLGVIEIGVALAALDVLFLAFVLVQLRYLFGGAAHVQETAGMTYAEYARRGFFELVWVAALSLGVLIGANGALRRERPRDETVFRLLAWTLLALLGVVMLSAVQRMRLYQSAYGLTEPRFYATACMAWLATVLAWFAATVLRGRGTPAFAFGTLVSAWLAVGVLDVANPDAIIARSNLARLERGARFDASYVSALGPDAVPVMVKGLVRDGSLLSADDRCKLHQRVAAWRTESKRDGWRTWNASLAAARAAAWDARVTAAYRTACPAKPAVAAAAAPAAGHGG